VTRNEIEVYAKARKLQWIEDDSNADSRYDRNFLRNDLLPRLDARFPATARRFFARQPQSGRLFGACEDLPRSMRARSIEGGSPLRACAAFRCARAGISCAGCCQPRAADAEQDKAGRALRQCRASASGSEVHVSFGSHGLRCFRGQVGIVENSARMPVDWNTSGTAAGVAVAAGLGVLRGRATLGEGIAARHFAQQGTTVAAAAVASGMRPRTIVRAAR